MAQNNPHWQMIIFICWTTWECKKVNTSDYEGKGHTNWLSWHKKRQGFTTSPAPQYCLCTHSYPEFYPFFIGQVLVYLGSKTMHVSNWYCVHPTVEQLILTHSLLLYYLHSVDTEVSAQLLSMHIGWWVYDYICMYMSVNSEKQGGEPICSSPNSLVVRVFTQETGDPSFGLPHPKRMETYSSLTCHCCA